MEKKEHPITWEQVGIFILISMFVGVLVLALWKVADLTSSEQPNKIDTWNCDIRPVIYNDFNPFATSSPESMELNNSNQELAIANFRLACYEQLIKDLNNR